MVEKTVVAPTPQPASGTRERTHAQEHYVTPPVNIYETPDGLVVMTDLPGVAEDNLGVRVDNDILTIRGHTQHVSPGDPIQREYELIDFFRQFELSDKVDQSKITAEFKYGVLTLSLPKAEAAKPRKIDVTVA